MIRVLFLFVVLTALIWLGLLAAQKMTGKQALSLTKNAGIAILCSSVALVLMFGLVILF